MEDRYEALAGLRFGQDATRIPRVFRGAAETHDHIMQEILRIEAALVRLTKALHEIRREQLDQMCRNGSLARDSLSEWSVEQNDLVRRYTARLAELRELHRPATV